MSYLLDTNICIYYINGQSGNLRDRIATQPREEVFICDPVKTELFYGVYKSSQKQKNLSVLRSFLQEFKSLPFDEQAAEICGKIRAELTAVGTPIGAYDFQIAAIALAQSLIDAMCNYSQIPGFWGLASTDWASF